MQPAKPRRLLAKFDQILQDICANLTRSCCQGSVMRFRLCPEAVNVGVKTCGVTVGVWKVILYSWLSQGRLLQELPVLQSHCYFQRKETRSHVEIHPTSDRIIWKQKRFQACCAVEPLIFILTLVVLSSLLTRVSTGIESTHEGSFVCPSPSKDLGAGS